MSDPYVVSLALEPDAQARLDAERREWFPVGRTVVGAHVTLFHAVPGEHHVDDDLAEVCARPAFSVRVASVTSLGRGAAYRLESAELHAVHGDLQRRWWSVLTRQDQQGFRPHVTVQNKVDPDTARATVATLSERFEAYDVAALGLDLWRYRGGPWERVRRHDFTPAR